MKWLFVIYLIFGIAAFVGGCLGAYYQFGLSALCFIVAGAFWIEGRKERSDFFK